jgi:nicotinate-nucleotide pyrophosphorylase (carboxylating)
MFVFHPLSQDTRARLIGGGLDPDAVAVLVRATVAEDLAGGSDVTSMATVPASQRSIASFGARQPGCVAGLAIAAAVIDAVCGPDASGFTYLRHDGDRVLAGEVVARVEAPTRLLLTAERSALNLLCHLSGVATSTAAWVDAIEGTGAVIRDTRKTMPGLRAVEKYAVRCGGGQNHRMALSDAALVKDNHIAAAGGVAQAFSAVRRIAADLPIEIEVDSLDDLRVALDAGADVILLDNMATADLVEAVETARAHAAFTGRAVVLEASGGLTLDRARAVAETGVDYLSIGALTHSAPVLDLGLDLETVL